MNTHYLRGLCLLLAATALLGCGADEASVIDGITAIHALLAKS